MRGAGCAFPPDAPFGYYNFTQSNIETEIQQWWMGECLHVQLEKMLSKASKTGKASAPKLAFQRSNGSWR
jgi:hypothetical protein